MTGTDAGDGPKRSRSNARSGNRPASSSASMTCASSASQAQSCSSGSGDTCGVIRQRMARSAGVRRVLLHHLTQRPDTGRGCTSHANCSPSGSIGYDRDRSVFFEPMRTADTKSSQSNRKHGIINTAAPTVAFRGGSAAMKKMYSAGNAMRNRGNVRTMRIVSRITSPRIS
jgi:hypothetical protein